MTALDVVVWIVMLVGLIGCLLPFVPGTPLIFGAALVHALVTGFHPVTVGRLAILGALTVIAVVIEHLGGALGARRFGGSPWAVLGALVGAVVGLFFGLPGLVLGPVVGAIGAELLHGRHVEASVRSGIGALVGIVAGAMASFAIGLAMIGLFAWWMWHA